LDASPLQLSFFDSPNPRSVPVRPSAERALLLGKASQLAHGISSELGVPVRLAVTDNRSTMVSFRRAGSGLRLRVHHMFLEAPGDIVKAIAHYAGRGCRRSGQALDEYILTRQPLIRHERHAKEALLNPEGRFFELKEMFDQLNQAHFEGKIAADIGWGRMPKKRRRKSIRLGVYDHQTREIRIHPALDRPEVPSFFVEFIVFHEMLHQLFPSGRGEGKRVHHPRGFRNRERTFPLYAEAIEWERENLNLLLKASS
jgi:hypothetical protein